MFKLDYNKRNKYISFHFNLHYIGVLYFYWRQLYFDTSICVTWLLRGLIFFITLLSPVFLSFTTFLKPPLTFTLFMSNAFFRLFKFISIHIFTRHWMPIKQAPISRILWCLQIINIIFIQPCPTNNFTLLLLKIMCISFATSSLFLCSIFNSCVTSIFAYLLIIIASIYTVSFLFSLLFNAIQIVVIGKTIWFSGSCCCSLCIAIWGFRFILLVLSTKLDKETFICFWRRENEFQFRNSISHFGFTVCVINKCDAEFASHFFQICNCEVAIFVKTTGWATKRTF